MFRQRELGGGGGGGNNTKYINYAHDVAAIQPLVGIEVRNVCPSVYGKWKCFGPKKITKCHTSR